MSKVTLAEVTTPVTRQQVQASIYSILGALGVDVTVWLSGSPLRSAIVPFSAMLEAFSKQLADVASSGFLQFATGDWLELVARHVYGVEKLKALFATGNLSINNNGGGLYDFNAGELVFASVITGKEYSNNGHVVISPGDTNVVVSVSAIEAGSGSTATPGTITRIVTNLVDIAATNPSALIGTDAELDPELRTRCSEKLGALSPMGPWDAYASALRNATRQDGSVIGITRMRIAADGYGHVDIYVANDVGGIAGNVLDPATDLGAAAVAIHRDAVPQSVTARLYTATAVPIAINYQVWAYNTSGRTAAQIETTIAAALQAWFPTEPIGGNVIDPASGRVYRDKIAAIIGAAMPEIFHVNLTIPAADTILSISQVPTYQLPTAGAITLVPPPEGYHP